uniref:Uncharacterized protein n=1 Tax=Candidatus Kentrum sp. FW TaxID=2126338 RepID=A0A450SS89_9GAMM|nr:MAG: hypothetical protein BECKFW1821A_GA0114235_10658 [Candidatus Kentron sp. FW]
MLGIGLGILNCGFPYSNTTENRKVLLLLISARVIQHAHNRSP